MTDETAGVGALLARAREARGLGLAEVALQLKFSQRQLEALEQDRYDLLPGATFARGMVRNYARLLKIDAEPLLDRLAGELQASHADRLAERYRQPVPFHDGTRRTNVIYLGVSVVVLAAVAALAYEWHRERTAASALAFVPAAEAPQEPLAPVAAEAAPPAPTQTASAAAAVALAAPLQATTDAPAASPAPETASAPADPGHARIVFRCEREAWIEVRDAAGRVIFAQLNPAGTERVVEGKGPFSLVVGNAQHVRVTYDDRAIDLAPFIKVEVARFTLP